jgi:hypothetical protein
MRIVVVLPAPFCPTNPQTAPRGIDSATSSTTLRPSKALVSPRVSTASSSLDAARSDATTVELEAMLKPYGSGSGGSTTAEMISLIMGSSKSRTGGSANSSSGRSMQSP